MSASSVDVTINSMEAILQGFGAGIPLDYMDLAFTPYVHTVGGGGISTNTTTYGGFNSPNLYLCKTSVAPWLKSAPFSGSPPFTFQYQLMVFATSSGSTTAIVSGTLHVVTNFDQGFCSSSPS